MANNLYIFLEDTVNFIIVKIQNLERESRMQVVFEDKSSSAKTLSSLLFPLGFSNATAATRCQARSNAGEGKIRRHGRCRSFSRV